MSTVYLRITARGPVAHTRAPLLERLLARAERRDEAGDWRARAFRLIAGEGMPAPPAASVALAACGGAGASGGWVYLATPVHLLAGTSRVSLEAAGVLDLDAAEADELAADFNRVLGGAHAHARLVRGRGNLLLCLFDAPLRAITSAPEQAVGQDLWGHLARGADAPRLRSLSSEIEMWLFAHALNERRRARSAPTVSALWLWGGGPADAGFPALQGWTAGDDPLFASFASETRYPGAARCGVITVKDWPGTDAWRGAEERWLAPALADLKAGRLESLEVSAGSSCFSSSRRTARRFWRRPRPWWETLLDGG